jgi:hypothetical protein
MIHLIFLTTLDLWDLCFAFLTLKLTNSVECNVYNSKKRRDLIKWIQLQQNNYKVWAFYTAHIYIWYIKHLFISKYPSSAPQIKNTHHLLEQKSPTSDAAASLSQAGGNRQATRPATYASNKTYTTRTSMLLPGSKSFRRG